MNVSVHLTFIIDKGNESASFESVRPECFTVSDISSAELKGIATIAMQHIRQGFENLEVVE